MNGRSGGYRAIVVDDSPAARQLVTLLLTNEPDLEVVGSADSGSDGLSLVRQLAPDVVITDLEMAGTDGLWLTTALHGYNPDLPVVMVTSSASPDDLHAARSAGVAHLLGKHDLVTDLVPAVRAALHGDQ